MLTGLTGLTGRDYGKKVTIPTSHGPRTGILDSIKVTKGFDILAVIKTPEGWKSGAVGTQTDNGPVWKDGIIVH